MNRYVVSEIRTHWIEAEGELSALQIARETSQDWDTREYAVTLIEPQCDQPTSQPS